MRRNIFQWVFSNARRYPEQFRRPESRTELQYSKEPGGRRPFSHRQRPSAFTIVAAVNSLGFGRNCHNQIPVVYRVQIYHASSTNRQVSEGLGAHLRLAPTPSPRARTLRNATSTAQLTITDPETPHSSALAGRESEFPRQISGGTRGLGVWTRLDKIGLARSAKQLFPS